MAPSLSGRAGGEADKTMKKIYNAPALLVVNLRTVHMMAESLRIESSDNPEYTINESSQILTKENNSIWDNEW